MTLFTNNFIHNHFWPVLAWYQPDPGLCNLALKRAPFWISRAKNYIYIFLNVKTCSFNLFYTLLSYLSWGASPYFFDFFDDGHIIS